MGNDVDVLGIGIRNLRNGDLGNIYLGNGLIDGSRLKYLRNGLTMWEMA